MVGPPFGIGCVTGDAAGVGVAGIMAEGGATGDTGDTGGTTGGMTGCSTGD